MKKQKIDPGTADRCTSRTACFPFPDDSLDTLAWHIFDLLGQAERESNILTVWDLRVHLDLPLADIFVGLRALEFDKLVCRGKPSQDPLTTAVSLTEKGRNAFFRRP